jgi:hypothetical protein
MPYDMHMTDIRQVKTFYRFQMAFIDIEKSSGYNDIEVCNFDIDVQLHRLFDIVA